MHETKNDIQEALYAAIDSTPEKVSKYYKTGPGEYAEFDKFLGIKKIALRKIASKYPNMPLPIIAEFLKSQFNEERLFSLIVLVSQYKKADDVKKEELYQFYLKNIKQVNNWNLVDLSAHCIVGAQLWRQDREILLKLTKSENMWERRIAIVATWYFIKKQDFTYTIKITEILLQDKHDLIHKACGWMLREVGKQQKEPLIDFLDKHVTTMPRTMLRYAIERLSEKERKDYLSR